MFVSLRLLIVGLNSSLILINFTVQFGNLIGRQSQVLLCVSHLFSKLFVLLQKILHLSFDAFILRVVLFDSLLVFCEFLEGFGLLSIRESYILLGISDFFCESRILLEQFLNLFLQGLTFLVICADSIFVFIEFLDYLLVLLGRQSEILLSFPDFSLKSIVLAHNLLHSVL